MKEEKDKLVAEIVHRVLTETGSVKAAAREIEKGVHLQPQITLRLAVALLERIEKRANELGMRIVAAVSDAAGRPVAIHCMDGAYIGSFDVALNKTYTAIAFQMSTARLGELAAPGQPLYGIQQTNEGKIVIFGGGEPLTAGDLEERSEEADGSQTNIASEQIIGAIGVSGGTAEQDTYLAAYARSIVKEVVSCL
ncbi:MAG: heme-binding protein [Lachnospiraceae bacterium]|jgi:uncharacterized protein GlcG (DUF336 family)|nr:heme-binding protein [uncultured Schaedlerella sp.]MCI8626408.1 heme-binding protein [Lachnospiraceae bacterium]